VNLGFYLVPPAARVVLLRNDFFPEKKKSFPSCICTQKSQNFSRGRAGHHRPAAAPAADARVTFGSHPTPMPSSPAALMMAENFAEGVAIFKATGRCSISSSNASLVIQRRACLKEARRMSHQIESASAGSWLAANFSTKHSPLVLATEERDTEAPRDLNPLTGLVTSSGALRRYRSASCKRDFMLPELTPAAVAQSAVWNTYGNEKPWWSVLTYMHRREPSREQMIQFYETGDEHVAEVMAELRYLAPRAARGAVLDFGCGLGRLAFAFAQHYERVYCVDQSVHHLRRASSAMASLNASRAGRINFVTTTPDLLAALGGARVDAVHSVIALQHVPKPLQLVYFEQLCDALHPGGVGWLHFLSATREATSAADPCDLDEVIRRSTDATGMLMHYTPARELGQILARRGCTVRVRTDSKKTNKHVDGRVALVTKVRAPNGNA
jgi:2-polyprenyl-3-methyl-5-hydroxy-6-metoxy-1,4-benzoquinol methylase